MPRWDGNDGYQLGSAELVSWLADHGGAWTQRGLERGEWSVAYLRSRRGSSRLRVEKWLHRPTGRIHFRSRDAANLLTVYGARPNAAARIADPADEARTLVWLPEIVLDPHGNALWFDYQPETADGIDRSAPYERRHTPLAQRYLKRIRYGNAAPLALSDGLLAGAPPEDLRWCFELVLDYGDHDDVGAPAAVPVRPWRARAPPCRAEVWAIVLATSPYLSSARPATSPAAAPAFAPIRDPDFAKKESATSVDAAAAAGAARSAPRARAEGDRAG